MSKPIKYLSAKFRRFDVSPCGRYNTMKLLIFISWIATILLFTGLDYLPLDTIKTAGTIDNSQQQTEELVIIALPPLDDIKFYCSEIGTVSSLYVIIIPREIKLIERERGPPFHISTVSN